MVSSRSVPSSSIADMKDEPEDGSSGREEGVGDREWAESDEARVWALNETMMHKYVPNRSSWGDSFLVLGRLQPTQGG